MAIGAIAAIGTLSLAGCVKDSQPRATDSPRASASASTSAAANDPAAPSSSSSASTAPSSKPSPTAGGTSLKVACGSLIPAQAVYDFNPNFGLDSSFTPPAGTPAATAVAAGGTACNWTNQTSHDTFTASIAAPSATSLASIKTKAAAGTAVSGYGDSAYFSTSGSVGRIDVFKGTRWLTVSSVYFSSANDASVLLSAAVGSL